MIRLLNILTSLGFWPACLLLALQYGFFFECQTKAPAHLLLLTFLGTCCVYVLDRFLEKTAGHFLEKRHELPLLVSCLVIILFLLCVFYFSVHASTQDWFWLTSLGGSGLLYLLTTSGWIPSFTTFKELLGTVIFCLLVLGRVPATGLFWAGLFCLALSNFTWSGFFDRDRDVSNSVQSIANWHEGKAVLLARFSGLTSGLLFLLSGLSFFLAAVAGSAALHTLWPKKYQKVDLAFIPLTLWVITIITLEIAS